MGRGKNETLARKPHDFEKLRPFFFCSRSRFRAITRLETLATQAKKFSDNPLETRKAPVKKQTDRIR